MRKLLWLFIIITLASIPVPAEESKTSTGEIFSDAYRNYLLDSQFALKVNTLTQEQIEVTAPDYPGLRIELPPLKERLEVPRPGILRPTHSPTYYQQGGQILSYWGFPTESGELVTVSTPVDKKN